MNYLVLARKYRPQNFSEIVGQDHIVTILKNAIKSGQIWHAYIFSGTRGTGKTSTARILAKVLNCHSLTENFEPCNKCVSCTEITNGNSVDVIEIDAASNRGIEEIRALRENVKFSPVKSKYKIYIIDEAHQITEHAFNAFLKTLEEPPPYVIFILATTEFQSIPLTIISRCQVFQFKPVDSKTIFKRLKYIVEQESKDIKIDDEVLELISQNSGGSIRDAISLLDQVLSFVEKGVVNIEIVRKMFGTTPREILEEYIDTILSNDVPKIISYIEKIYSNGIDFLQFSKDLLESYRGILFETLGLVPQNKIVDTKKYSKNFNLTQLVANIQTVLRLIEDIKKTEYPKVVLELYSIKLTKQYVDIDQLINLFNKENLPTTSNLDSSNSKQENFNNLISEPEKLNETQTTSLSLSEEEITLTWEKFLEKIKLEKPLLYNTVLLNSETLLKGDILLISFPNNYMKTAAKKYLPVLEEFLKNFFGKDIKIETVVTPSKEEKVLKGNPNDETNQSLQYDKIKTIPLKPKKSVDPEVEKFVKLMSGKILSGEKVDITNPNDNNTPNFNFSEEQKNDKT